MEECKVQALHDTLAKLQKSAGLGVSSYYNFGKIKTKEVDGKIVREDGLPNNPLYYPFVREGTYDRSRFDAEKYGDGRVIKRNFDDCRGDTCKNDNSSYEKSSKKKKKVEAKEIKKAAKRAAKVEAKRKVMLEAKRQAKLEAKRKAKAEQKQRNEIDVKEFAASNNSTIDKCKSYSKKMKDLDGKSKNMLKTEKNDSFIQSNDSTGRKKWKSKKQKKSKSLTVDETVSIDLMNSEAGNCNDESSYKEEVCLKEKSKQLTKSMISESTQKTNINQGEKKRKKKKSKKLAVESIYNEEQDIGKESKKKIKIESDTNEKINDCQVEKKDEKKKSMDPIFSNVCMTSKKTGDKTTKTAEGCADSNCNNEGLFVVSNKKLKSVTNDSTENLNNSETKRKRKKKDSETSTVNAEPTKSVQKELMYSKKKSKKTNNKVTSEEIIETDEIGFKENSSKKIESTKKKKKKSKE